MGIEGVAFRLFLSVTDGEESLFVRDDEFATRSNN